MQIVGPRTDKASALLTQAGVLSVIRRVWETTYETARRVLVRIEKRIERAIAGDPGRSGGNAYNNVLRMPRCAPVAVWI
jgi:hypothetical protein